MTSAGEPVVMVLANWRASGDFIRTQPWLRTPGTLAGAFVPWMPRPSLGSPRRTNTGYAVVQFFLNRFRDVPGGVEGFGADFVRTEVGLRHRFTHCDRINFRQFTVCVEEKALLRDIDNDVVAL